MENSITFNVFLLNPSLSNTTESYQVQETIKNIEDSIVATKSEIYFHFNIKQKKFVSLEDILKIPSREVQEEEDKLDAHDAFHSFSDEHLNIVWDESSLIWMQTKTDKDQKEEYLENVMVFECF